MTDYVGLTWDHPRGRAALEAAAMHIGGGDTLRWEVQSLEGFESAPIDELAARYDLLVLDHPHLGDALATGSLRPMDDLFEAAQLRTWEQAAVGPSIASYRAQGRLWALPLDAATQVSVRRRDLIPDAPLTWTDIIEHAADGQVALSLAGPHAFLSLCSMTVALGDDPATGEGLFNRQKARQAIDLLTAIAAHAPQGSTELNPIGLLDRMRDQGDIALIPLVYGYVNYSSDQVAFGPAPVFAADDSNTQRVGSTIGGTGIAVTHRSEPSAALREHLRWLLDPHTQRTFIPRNHGQPSAREAWTDPTVDREASGFYSATLTTIEQSWVRPRIAGYIPFQARASQIVRAAVLDRRPADHALDEIEDRYAAVRAATEETL